MDETTHEKMTSHPYCWYTLIAFNMTKNASVKGDERTANMDLVVLKMLSKTFFCFIVEHDTKTFQFHFWTSLRKMLQFHRIQFISVPF
jgi:hypothetical protein